MYAIFSFERSGLFGTFIHSCHLLDSILGVNTRGFLLFVGDSFPLAGIAFSLFYASLRFIFSFRSLFPPVPVYMYSFPSHHIPIRSVTCSFFTRPSQNTICLNLLSAYFHAHCYPSMSMKLFPFCAHLILFAKYLQAISIQLYLVLSLLRFLLSTLLSLFSPLSKSQTPLSFLWFTYSMD